MSRQNARTQLKIALEISTRLSGDRSSNGNSAGLFLFKIPEYFSLMIIILLISQASSELEKKQKRRAAENFFLPITKTSFISIRFLFRRRRERLSCKTVSSLT